MGKDVGIYMFSRVLETSTVRVLSQAEFHGEKGNTIPNSGMASMALSKYVLGMVYCGAGKL